MRLPFQVIILPYRFFDNECKVLIGKRSGDNYWQAFSGGGESLETPIQTAKRELKEESNLEGTEWIQLDSICTLPKIYYPDYESWVDHPYVIPEYAFMTKAIGDEIISFEHSEFRWCTEWDSIEMLKYDSNKNAAWEMYQRLRAHNH